MPYLTKESLAFFEELAGENTRERFDENRQRYLTHIKKPFQSLVKDLIERVKKEDPLLHLELKDAIFRINRDIRFSKNKTPYKTYVGACINRGGKKNMSYPGMYIQCGWDGLKFISGSYQPNKDELYHIRKAISQHPRKIKKLLSSSDFVSFFGEVQGKKHKRIPKEFKEAHGKQSLIAHKQFYYSCEYSPGNIYRDDLVDFFMEHRDAAKSMNQFLIEAMKNACSPS